jgi:uncharacterized protein YkwD
MKRLSKKIAIPVIAGCLILGASLTSYAGQWKTDARGWTYQNDDGSFAANQWVLYNGSYYHMNSAGVMETNAWVNDNGSWYWLDGNGVMVKSCSKEINGKWYRFSDTGAMKRGWDYQDSKWYYFDNSGAMKTGWQYVNNNWYYLGGSDGSMTTGWLTLGDNKYYLFSDGHMATGIVTLEGKQQLFLSDGRWVQDADTNNGQSTDSNVTIDSLFNAAYEDMTWDDIESLAKKYYSNFYQTSVDAVDTFNQWRASNYMSNLTFSSSLTKSAFALAISNKSHGYEGVDNASTGAYEYYTAANLFNVSVKNAIVNHGDSLSEAIKKLYNKSDLQILTSSSYSNIGFGFVRKDDGTYIIVVEVN